MTGHSSDYDDDLDLTGLDELEILETGYTTGKILPPKSFGNTSNLKQRDLFGGTIVEKERDKGVGTSKGRGGSFNAQHPSSGGITEAKVKIIKRWDLTSFSKHGWSKRVAAEGRAKSGKGKGKGKKRDYGSDEEPWDEEEEVLDDEGEGEGEVGVQYDEAELLPIKWSPDPIASKTWVYPVQDDKPLRTYQYNIVHRALFADTLVSLPTGLGKTFIAACVMLNFYRWYPRGKIVFLAPTRPLVAQQIKACHYIAGIPQSECVELTGQTATRLRAVAWASKRVIYCTPQTMENDLKKGRLDPRDVTCLVVDEAHRASGDYAYCGVVRFMMSRNQHFRVLALTATPGAKGEAVQNVIDSLHIGRIEVRTDESMDIKQYMHTKSFDLTSVPLGSQIELIRDRWSKLMMSYLGPCLEARLLYERNPTLISPYSVQSAYAKIKDLPGGPSANGRFFSMLKTLGAMARAMEYLILHSLTSFHESLKDLESENKTLANKSEFRDLMRDTRNLRDKSGYVGHPKMDKLRSMCIEHFKSYEGKVDEDGKKMETRVMVFCNYRAVVDEIVGCLNSQRPLIKATAFVGQASAKGSAGRSQKDQIETIGKFKAGIHNVLVATSIGEEGLDIGEIDLIVCYEANKSPIRMLQRVGRTGRARDGRIIVLMTEGREEKNWEKANDAYNAVQNALVSNKTFELYCDGDRMLPSNVKPEVEKIKVEALPLKVDTMTMAGEARLIKKNSAEEKKQQKAKEMKAKVPDDAFLGFRTAGQLAADIADQKIPSPDHLLRDRKAAALLTTEEDNELRERWRFVGNKSVTSTIFDTQSIPFERGFTGAANRIPSHSTRFNDVLAILRNCEVLGDSQVENLDKWTDKMSNAYDPKKVRVWNREGRSNDYRPHKRIRQTTPDLAPMSTFPLPTATNNSRPLILTSSISSNLPAPSSFERILPPHLTQPRALPKVLPRVLPKVLPPPPVQPREQPPPPRKPLNKVISRPQLQEQLIPVAPLVLTPRDQFGILSSSEPDELPPAKPNTASTYHFDDDDDAISDGELMKSAIVNGGRKEIVRVTGEITIESEEEEEDAILGPTHPEEEEEFQAAHTGLNSITIPDSDEEMEDHNPLLLPIKRLLSVVATRPRVSPPASRLPPTSESEDEYSFFDLPDEDELKALETAAIKGQTSIPSLEEIIEEGTENATMPPPRSTIPIPKQQPTKIRVVVEETYKKRPQHHRIPDSDSSLPSIRSTHSQNALTPSDDDAPILAKRGGRTGKKFVVADSSSPPEQSIAVPSKLNRLRRGGKEARTDSDEDDDDDDDEVEESVESAPKKKKSERMKIDAKTAARSKLFDVEAINSSASGSEASSEEYSEEGSQDRIFAGEDWELEDDPSDQAQFYRDSLATQHDSKFAPAYRRDALTRRVQGERPMHHNVTPNTPHSIDTYSFDSFCCDDDVVEMEEEDDSSQQ